MIHRPIHTSILTCREDHVTGVAYCQTKRKRKEKEREGDKEKQTDSSGKRAIMLFFPIDSKTAQDTNT